MNKIINVARIQFNYKNLWDIRPFFVLLFVFCIPIFCEIICVHLHQFVLTTYITYEFYLYPDFFHSVVGSERSALLCPRFGSDRDVLI